MKLRRKTIWKVHVTVQGDIHNKERLFTLHIEARGREAALRKAVRVCHEKFGTILANTVAVSSSNTELWY